MQISCKHINVERKGMQKLMFAKFVQHSQICWKIAPKRVLFCFVCVEVLRPCQRLRSCRFGQLPINTVPGQA